MIVSYGACEKNREFDSQLTEIIENSMAYEGTTKRINTNLTYFR
jgi:hypothetical protein